MFLIKKKKYFFLKKSSGQCRCLDSRGGQTCNECKDGYWGDPKSECKSNNKNCLFKNFK